MKGLVEKTFINSKCDVLICDGIHMAVNVPFDLSCRKVLDEHNVESTIIERFMKLVKNPLAKIYSCIELLKFKNYENKLWPRFNEIHVCSGVDKIQVEKRSGHRNVKVVPNGVDCASHKPQEHKSARAQEKHFQLVYSGLMGWKPNEDAALYFAKEMYPRIKDKMKNVNWTIVGKGPKEEVKNLEKEGSIKVTGFVDDVKPYIYGSDVFVVPLRIGSGTRLKILEAMAMGIAIVSTSIGCEGIDVEHGKNIFIADDPGDFAKCVVDLLSNDGLRFSIAEAGRKLVEEKYDWDIIGNDLAKMIK
jgi:glycosyltransferase involved in cell wall biosynthesis